jgi:O-antigen ligase
MLGVRVARGPPQDQCTVTTTGLLFSIAFIASCVLALARGPIYGMLAYVAVFYLNPPIRWWGQGVLADIRWSLVTAAVTLVALLIHRGRWNGTPFFKQPVVIGLCLLLAWMVVQLPWILDRDLHVEVIEYYAKFVIAMYLIYYCVDSERNLRLFLWAHVLGCFYFGWLVFTTYTGGRFDNFGGAGLKDANEVALTMGTAALALGSLLLTARWPGRVVAVGVAPFIVNGLVATISRSAFLALVVGGAVYNWFTPARWRKWVVALSALAVVLLLMLTTESYWSRIQTIAMGGQIIEGVDTGVDRIAQWRGQLRMFRDHPLGCGHHCTTILSPSYFESWVLAERAGVRSSHNTFLSMLVDHGVPGGLAYVALLSWVLLAARRLRRSPVLQSGSMPLFVPAVVGSLLAMFVGDMFVPYVRYEVRFWFIALLLVLLRLAQESSQDVPATPAEPRPERGGARNTGA